MSKSLFKIKLQALKKRLLHRCFSVIFAKLLRTRFDRIPNTSGGPPQHFKDKIYFGTAEISFKQCYVNRLKLFNNRNLAEKRKRIANRF